MSSPGSTGGDYDRATRGDGPALTSLLERYLPNLRAFVRARLGRALAQREASADVVQSVCREVIAERGRFEFRGESQFRGWLFTAALNKIREKHRFHRAERRDAEREQALPVGTAEEREMVATLLGQPSPSQAAIAHEQLAAVDAALGELSDEHREVITLARFAALPHREIAELMGRSEAAVRQLLGRALAKLGAALERRGILPRE